jgi:hypothetical protein
MCTVTNTFWSESANKCVTCPGNTYNYFGQDFCKGCNAGFFFDATASTGCSPCPSGEGSPYNAKSCARCSAGTYLTSGGYCDSCPAGCECHKKNHPRAPRLAHANLNPHRHVSVWHDPAPLPLPFIVRHGLGLGEPDRRGNLERQRVALLAPLWRLDV